MSRITILTTHYLSCLLASEQATCISEGQLFNIIECGNSFNQIEDILSKQSIDLIIARVNGTNYLQRLRNIIRADTNRKVIITGELDQEAIIEYIKVGVKGFIGDNISSELLNRAIRVVHKGEVWFDRGMSSKIVKVFSGLDATVRQSGDNTLLSKRELEIMECMSRGLKNRDIARILYISESTVKTHLRNVYEKLDVKDRMSAVLRMQQR